MHLLKKLKQELRLHGIKIPFVCLYFLKQKYLNMRVLFSLLLAFTSLASQAKPTSIDSVLEELNPTFFQKDFSSYNQQTARFCGALSDATYMTFNDCSQLERRLNNLYGVGRFSISKIDVPETHTRALVCATDDFVVIGFRGTEFEVMKDIITDLKINRYINAENTDSRLDGLPAGHAGFRKGCMKLLMEKNLFDTLRKIISRRSGTSDPKAIPIYLTGHSMGAAYASMFVRPIAKAFSFGGAYNFAPPLAISCSDATEIKSLYGDKIHDIVNYKDYVARAGRSSRNRMRHIGQHFYRASVNRELFSEEEFYIRWRREEFGFRNMIYYHRMVGYRDIIRSEANSNELISLRAKNGNAVFNPAKYRKIKCF